MKHYLVSLIVICSTCIGIVTTSYASMQGEILLTPKNPEPNSPVTLTFTTRSFDPDFAYFVWKVNNVTVLEGEGQKNMTLTTGAIGEPIFVTMKASNYAGYKIEQQLELSPSFVSLIYEAPSSHTPHFYEGRSLPSTGGEIKVTALPFLNTKQTLSDPSQFSYTWYLNDAILSNVSGKGKQTAIFALDYLRIKNNIKVVVKNQDGTTKSKEITVLPHEVMPRLYEYDELFGTLLHKQIGKRFETTKDFVTILEPFYVSRSNQKNDKTATFSWLLDGMESTPLGGRILAFSPKENSYGTKKLSISVYGPDKRLQKGLFESVFVFDTRK